MASGTLYTGYCQLTAGSSELSSASKPDSLHLLGDTDSSIVAISAKRPDSPVFHLEAGDGCFDHRVSNESPRPIYVPAGAGNQGD